MCVHGNACGHIDREANCTLPPGAKCPVVVEMEEEAKRNPDQGQKKIKHDDLDDDFEVPF